MLEIRIGIVDSPKEISLEVEGKPAELIKKIESAVGQESGMLWIKDRKGKQVGIPSQRFAYVEIETETASRSVGFRP